MMPSQILRYRDIPDDMMSSLIQIHFPWIPYRMYNRDISLFELYRQGYLSIMNMGDQPYQQIYNEYLYPILMDAIGRYFWLPDDEREQYDTIYQIVSSNYVLVQDILQGKIDGSVSLDVLQMRRDSDDN